MTKHPHLLWMTTLAVGWLFDFLFWGKSLGINFAIFMSACLLAGFFLLRANDLKPAANSLWLIIPFIFFAAITVVRQEPLTLFLAHMFALLALGILAVTYRGGGWMQYRWIDYGVKFFKLTLSVYIRPIVFYSQLPQERETLKMTIKGWPYKAILRGVVIAIPIVIWFSALLASADLVFNQKIIDFYRLFDLGKGIELIFRLILILLWAYGLLGVIIHAGLDSSDAPLSGADKPLIKPFLGFTEASIVMGSVLVLFLSFVLIQFRYFFGGEVNIGVEGFTYSQYARRGFSELINVAFFSLLMIIGLNTLTKRDTAWQKRVYSGMSAAIAVLVIVMLVSAFQRLNLAIDWHGFSRLRLYPRVFLIWVGILFITVIILEIIRRERYLTLAFVAAACGFAASLSLTNVDASIVHHNVMRAVQGRHFNVNHLTSLSLDAVPALADEFTQESLPLSIREGVGAALLCYLHSDAYAKTADMDWRSFNFSRWEAVNALEAVQTHLEDYRVNTRLWPILVTTPNHVHYECAD